MNVIREEMQKIHASEELKRNTLRYLNRYQEKAAGCARRPVLQYMAAAVCLFFLVCAGGYFVYGRPVSYISIDVNPSIELGINCFGRVVSAEAYNEDGEEILNQLSLKNVSYMQAIDNLLENERNSGFLTEETLLVFTVIADKPETFMDEISADKVIQGYNAVTYRSDRVCMQEAHRYEMSFGKYRACLELQQYDQNITIGECHKMTMGDIQDRIESCESHHEIYRETNHESNGRTHRGHHGRGH